MVRDQVIMHIAQVISVIHMHVRTCNSFRISGMAGRIALKFGVWFGVLLALAMRFTQTKKRGASARTDVPTPFPYLGNSWTHYAEIWRVVMDQLTSYAL